MARSGRSEVHAVTGAFGYTGRYIARRILDAGARVITLTNSPQAPDPFDGRVPAFPLQFTDRHALTDALRDVAVLYNTYWVRFDQRSFSHREAIANSLTLFAAAREAGVRRIVHVSITNPDATSDLPYFSGKAKLEAALQSSGLSYAILRPTVLFGEGDILINNIAWILRRVPIFAVFGDGAYRLQPIFVDDLAALAVTAGARTDNVTVDAIGPETFSYRELVQTIAAAIGCPRPVVSLPPRLGYWAGRLIGLVTGDVLITWEEVRGLMQERLFVDVPPAGSTRFTEWARQHAASLGARYAHELGRRRPRNQRARPSR